MKEVELLKKPWFWLILVLILIWAIVFQLPDSQLHLVFCDVGQGDAILITKNLTQILIDGGPNNRVLDCLGNNLPFWDQQIEMVISTHPDVDHLTGLIDVIERYSIKYFVVNSLGKDSMVFKEFQRAVEEEKAVVYFPKKGDRIGLADLNIRVLWPETQDKVLGATTIEKKANESSIVFQLSYGNFDALFPGDITSQVELQLNLTDIELLKVAHHGSKYSTSEKFLEQVQPELAVVSVGKNPWDHPTQEVIGKLRNSEVKILRTDEDGEIEIVSDGKRWGIRK